jgi:8-oxo-dGTP pyrophosphatase MutT (NUDIX family)
METISTGASDQEFSSILGEEKGGLAYWIACIRECFEEAGILIAYKGDGSVFNPSDADERKRFVEYRNRLNAGEPVLENMCKQEGLTLATDRLAYLAHWITPKIEKRRYTTRFFVAISPSGQEGLHDGSESVNSLWIKPEEALRKQEEGELLLIMPTIKNLQSICGYSNVEQLLKDKSSIDPTTIPTIEPKFFMEDGKMVGLLPGDEGYEEH